jgi:hypothetical protein
MRALVVTPCTAGKLGNVPRPATAEDLRDPERRRRAEERLASYAQPALAMYTGKHHRLVVEGVRAVRERWGEGLLDVAVLSGGYGLLDAGQIIIPYDVTFDQFTERELAEWAAGLGIRERAAELASGYDLVFYLLSGRYLAVLGLPLEVQPVVQQIVLTDQESLALVPEAPHLCPLVAHGPVAARRWHVKSDHVRGFLFGRLCRQIVEHGQVILEWLARHPEDTDLLFYKHTPWRPQFALWRTETEES